MYYLRAVFSLKRNNYVLIYCRERHGICDGHHYFTIEQKMI